LPKEQPRESLLEKIVVPKHTVEMIVKPAKAVKPSEHGMLVPTKAHVVKQKDRVQAEEEALLREEAEMPAAVTPDAAKKKEKEKKRKEKIAAQYALYIVQAGDSLVGIAKKFGLNVPVLARINHLKEKQALKVGQRLRIPMSQERADAITNAFYIVRKGDTLSGIARKFKVKLRDLRKYNKIRKKSLIHIGQGLVLPLPHKLLQLKRIEAVKRKIALKKRRERERLAKLALKKSKRARFLKISKKLTRKLSVTATAYTSHSGQTDKTPFLAAWNNRIRPGMKIIAVSRDLIYRYGITNGSKVRISGLSGIYTVRDKMNKKWRKKIDIYMGTSRWRALRWGRRRVTIYY